MRCSVLDSPYRDMTRPAVEYIADIRRPSPRDVVAVYIPEYVVEHWWEQLLHNQSALRLKARLLFQPGVMVTSVPWRLRTRRRARARAVHSRSSDHGRPSSRRGRRRARAVPTHVGVPR